MSPVEGHIASILEDVVVGMPHDGDVAMTGGSFGTEGVESMLGVGTVAADGRSNLFVHNNVDFDTGLCPSLQDLVQSPFLVVVRWSS